MGLSQEPGRINSDSKDGNTKVINEIDRDSYILPAPEVRDCDEPKSFKIITDDTGLDGATVNFNLYGEILSILADATC